MALVKHKYQILTAVFFMVMLNCVAENNEIQDLEDNRKLKLTVFYETLCYDCINFFTQQLTPTYNEMGKFFKLDLVPYGKSQQNYSEGDWHFTCQHGPYECEYNKLHACAMNKTKSEKSLYGFLSCLMQDRQEESHLDECANKYKVNVTAVNQCRHSKEGNELLAKLGDRTHNFKPQLKFYPTVAFNRKYSQEIQDEAIKNLKKVVCKKLKYKPKSCKRHED